MNPLVCLISNKHQDSGTMDNVDGIAPFFDQHIRLLKRERDAEIEQSSLLLSNCSPKLLEQRGLALLNLNVLNITIGLGGRRRVLTILVIWLY